MAGSEVSEAFCVQISEEDISALFNGKTVVLAVAIQNKRWLTVILEPKDSNEKSRMEAK